MSRKTITLRSLVIFLGQVVTASVTAIASSGTPT
jgi:hypothetical protein